jgi:hypothetical protein
MHYENTNHYWLIISLLSLLVACQSQPKFINHPQPNLPIPLAFDVGCSQDDYGSRPCISNRSLAALGCDEIQVPSSLVGALHPSYPIAVCQIRPGPDQTKEMQAEIEQGLYFYYTGGLFGSYLRYIIVQDGAFRLIKSEGFEIFSRPSRLQKS